jgi:hypothetical protein
MLADRKSYEIGGAHMVRPSGAVQVDSGAIESEFCSSTL